jgi:NitT/TauT family transport system ATP-binding protein
MAQSSYASAQTVSRQAATSPSSKADSAFAVTVAAVSHRYGDLEVLRDVSLDVAPGEVVGIVGPSGCGKSTLLSLIAGLEPPTQGTVTAADGALMPQRDLVMPWRDALGNASIALENAGVGRSQARGRARELFARFDLGHFERARSWELSGGMRQRVAFIRTLLAEKPLLLLDEPFASLDAITRIELQDWLVDALAQEPRTVVMVSHDIEEALVVCDRVIVLSARPGRRVMETPGRMTRDSPELGAARARVLEALR